MCYKNFLRYNSDMNKIKACDKTTNTSNESEIKQRLAFIKKYYDLDALLAHGTEQQDVAKYYRKSDFFYNLVHSGGGSNIHMAISNGSTFDREDFKKQADYVAKFIKDGYKILEVGAGRVSNSKRLANLFPKAHFTALDIPNRNFLKNKVPKNITLIEGDYHNLDNLEDNSFDVVFGVETICYSRNKQQVIKQMMKKLKPGGVFIVFDVFEPKPKSKMSEFEKTVSSIALAGMRVTNLDHYIGDYKQYLKNAGAEDIEVKDLTENIKPSLKRLAKFSRLYFTHPLLVKSLKIFLAEDANINSIAGFLMDLTFDGKNIHVYHRITAKKAK